MLKQLDVIRDVGERLLGLSQSRAVPENIANNLQEDAESIKWAHQELRKLHAADSLLIIGHSSVLSHIFALPVEEIRHYETDPDIGYVILIVPEPIIVEQVMEFFSKDKNNTIPINKLPDWLKCRKFFVCSDLEDKMKKAVLFDCVLLKQWLNEYGTKTAKVELKKWMYDIFNAIKCGDKPE